MESMAVARHTLRRCATRAVRIASAIQPQSQASFVRGPGVGGRVSAKRRAGKRQDGSSRSQERHFGGGTHGVTDPSGFRAQSSTAWAGSSHHCRKSSIGATLFNARRPCPGFHAEFGCGN